MRFGKDVNGAKKGSGGSRNSRLMPGQPYALGAGLVPLVSPHRPSFSQTPKHGHRGLGVCYSLLTCFTEVIKPGEASSSFHSFAQPIRYVLSIATI